MKLIQIHPSDNVAIALAPIAAGETVALADREITAVEDIPQGHKLALSAIEKDCYVIKYGNPIGWATTPVAQGQWVHTHNVHTTLSETEEYTYDHKVYSLPEVSHRTFEGYRRPDGRAAVRNEIWILPTVGCVNNVAQHLVQINQHLVSGSLEGIYAFTHPFGCSQMGDDHIQNRHGGEQVGEEAPQGDPHAQKRFKHTQDHQRLRQAELNKAVGEGRGDDAL